MNRTQKLPILFRVSLLLIVGMLVFAPVGAVMAQDGPPEPTLPDTPSHIQLTVLNVIPEDNVSWPIVRIERTVIVDKASGQPRINTLVVRESPPTRARGQACPQIAKTAGRARPPLVCTNSGERQFYETSSAGQITMHVRHTTDKVCDGVTCVWNRPKALLVWWTRANNNWYASGAVVWWGCYSCNVCTGGSFESVWQSSSWIPTWQNSTTSSGYQFTSSSYPAMIPFDGTGDRAQADSNGYEISTFRGPMSANPGF